MLINVDLFARDAKKPSLVNVTSKAYRRVFLTDPGEYTATLTYNGGAVTKATWLVRDLEKVRKTKNIILYVCTGSWDKSPDPVYLQFYLLGSSEMA
jgi:hypothetical protein